MYHTVRIVFLLLRLKDERLHYIIAQIHLFTKMLQIIEIFSILRSNTTAYPQDSVSGATYDRRSYRQHHLVLNLERISRAWRAAILWWI